MKMRKRPLRDPKSFQFSGGTLVCVVLIIWIFIAMSVEAGDLSSNSRAELLVKLRRDAVAHDAMPPHATVGATLVRSFDELGWQLVRLPEGMSASEGMRRYRAHPAVVAVEPNGVIHLP